MIAPAPSLSLCWQKPSPLFINLSSRCPSTVALRHTWARVFLPHLAFLHASQSVFGYYRTRFSSSPHPPFGVMLKDMCGIAIRRVLCLEWALPEGGIISPAQGHQTRTHTSRATLEVNVTEGAPTAPGNRFLSHFVSLLSPFTLLKRPRSKALWEVTRHPVGKGGRWGYRGLMRWRIPTECLHRQILIKTSSVSSFVSSSALWPFFFYASRESSLHDQTLLSLLF